MSALHMSDVRRIAQQAAASESQALDVAAVVGAGGTDYVEVLINVRGCTADPCQLELGVLRSMPEDELKAEIVTQLRHHLLAHRTDTCYHILPH